MAGHFAKNARFSEDAVNQQDWVVAAIAIHF